MPNSPGNLFIKCLFFHNSARKDNDRPRFAHLKLFQTYTQSRKLKHTGH